MTAAPLPVYSSKKGPGIAVRASTPIARWKAERNAAIAELASQGYTVRSLGYLWDLDPSQISRIIQASRSGNPRRALAKKIQRAEKCDPAAGQGSATWPGRENSAPPGRFRPDYRRLPGVGASPAGGRQGVTPRPPALTRRSHTPPGR